MIVLFEPHGHIYRSTMIKMEYKTRQDQILVYPIVPLNHILNRKGKEAMGFMERVVLPGELF